MLSLLRKLFGIETVDDQKYQALQVEIYNIRKEMITLSNIVGKIATQVDSLPRVVNQHVIELDKLTKTQLELEYENAALIESLRSSSGAKNRLIAFPLGRDDDDDLIN